jgi:hypothetical protein
MSDLERYVLDANSFIRSKREHYAFDFCPGFWDALLKGYGQGRVISIDRVRKELLKGKDALADWVKDEVPDEFFESEEIDDVQKILSEVLQWVEDSEQYNRPAKQRFASGADPWLIAFARARRLTLVTYEVSAPESKALIKLPDVARAFSVTAIPPYVMLRRLEIVLALSRRSSK